MLDTRIRFAYFSVMNLTSKLSDLGVTIFALMTQLANKHGAINPSQSFPDFDTHPELISMVEKYIRTGHNQKDETLLKAADELCRV